MGVAETEVAARLPDLRGDVVYTATVTRVFHPAPCTASTVYHSVVDLSVKSGTLSAVVDNIREDGGRIGRTLLLTYRPFATPHDLLSLLTEVCVRLAGPRPHCSGDFGDWAGTLKLMGCC